MAKIIIGDVTANADITIGDDSMVSHATLQELSSGSTKFVTELPRSIQDADFQSANLGAVFQSPKIAIDAQKSLTVKSGVNCALTRYTAKDKALLGTDPSVPKIDIGNHDYWMSFALQATLEVGGAASLGSGFGVSLKAGSAVKLTGYSLFQAGAAALPSLAEAIGTTLTDFGTLATAKEMRNLKPGTVRAADISGTVTVSGSYSLPISVNQLALAESLVPFQFTVNPSVSVKVGGSVALTGDHSVICWRSSHTQIVFALMKKKGATLTATFTAGAGLTASAGSGDLIENFFKAVAPDIDLAKAGLTKDDARYQAISDVLTDSLNRAFSISVNAACAATFSDQATLIYAIDLPPDTDAAKTAATDHALNAALNGDWSQLANLPNVRELRNVAGSSHETKSTLSVNLLGIFNYESMSDFLSSSTVVHNTEDGSVTITDSHTAKRITAASTPYRADAEKLRKVLHEAAVATAVYTVASGKKLAPDFKMKQSMLIYKARMSAADLRKNLRLAVWIGELTSAQLEAIPMANPCHVLLDANQALGNDQLFKIFFTDQSAGTPHKPDELTRLGRRTLAALLDPADTADARRISVLQNDQVWHDMDTSGGKPPSDSPTSYDDWYDVTFWCHAVHNTAGPLKAVLDAWQQLPAGSDPSKNPDFMQKRDALKKALGDTTHDTRAAFEMGWPIAIMYALCGGATGAALKATWNGIQQVPATGTPSK